MYQPELSVVRERWRRREWFNFVAKREIIQGIKLIACIIVITMAMPHVEFLAIVADLIALSIVVIFGKWLIRRGE